ncbi:hypothetical protein [Pseudomonas violetae]|uniref:Uncharacterized protein n=1 Tax=Pseudomonas violetae TaxID=2915813 RepID=A0ABT0ET39_9PSED|nr:hypothetical protein [Pseudomonas violetae]MCK1788895.1 hypothetical protein [Pseudomonas violetae]
MTFTPHSTGTKHFEKTYGAAAKAMRDLLSFLYARQAGTEPTEWTTAMHTSGLVVLLPVAEDQAVQGAYDAVDPAETFAKAAMRACEAFVEEEDDDEEQTQLSASLVRAAEAAQKLVRPNSSLLSA